MRSFIVSAVVLLVVLAAGCNPVGMDDTRCWVRGRIYTDASRTTGAEDVGVFTIGTQESYVTMTNENGDFFIEIQLYPVQEEGFTGTTGTITFGLKATFEAMEYTYGAEDEFFFTVFGGDTLTMYDIDLSEFKPIQGK
jgi:hypothetical protein